MRKTIGLIIHSLEWTYSGPLWRGVEHRCAELDINLVTIQGDHISRPGTRQYERNKIYDLATAMDIDGFLVSSTAAHHCTSEESKRFFERLAPKPIVLR